MKIEFTKEWCLKMAALEIEAGVDFVIDAPLPSQKVAAPHLSKDTIAVMEIDKVMLCAGQHWPDVEGEAMIVRHVKQLTRMLNAELEAKKANSTLVKAVATLRRAVRTVWMQGVEDWRKHYDPELLALLGCKHFQDLYEDAPDPIERVHITDGSPCWCYPETDYTDPNTGASVVIHKEPQ